MLKVNFLMGVAPPIDQTPLVTCMGKNELFINECYNPAAGAIEAYEVKFSF